MSSGTSRAESSWREHAATRAARQKPAWVGAFWLSHVLAAGCSWSGGGFTEGPSLGSDTADAGKGDWGENEGNTSGGAAGILVPGEPATLLEGSFEALAIAPPYLYLVDGAEPPGIVRISTRGGPPEAVSHDPSALPYRIVAAAPDLYGAVFSRPTRTELWRMPLSGGGFSQQNGGVLLGEVRSVVAFGVDGSSLVSLEARPTERTVERSIHRVDLAEAAGAELVGSLTPLFSDAFAFGGTSAYVVRDVAPAAEIVRVPIDGSPSSTLLGGEPDESFSDLAVAGEDIGFASNTRVGSIAAAGGGAVTLVAEPAYRVRLDEGAAYYFTALAGCPDGSELRRVSRSGGAPVRLAHEPEPGCVQHVVADAEALYWLSASGTRVRKISKY